MPDNRGSTVLVLFLKLDAYKLDAHKYTYVVYTINYYKIAIKSKLSDG